MHKSSRFCFVNISCVVHHSREQERNQSTNLEKNFPKACDWRQGAVFRKSITLNFHEINGCLHLTLISGKFFNWNHRPGMWLLCNFTKITNMTNTHIKLFWSQHVCVAVCIRHETVGTLLPRVFQSMILLMGNFKKKSPLSSRPKTTLNIHNVKCRSRKKKKKKNIKPISYLPLPNRRRLACK